MNTYPHLVICEHCDAVYERRPLAQREVALCTACASVLYRTAGLNVRERFAMCVTAAIAFLIANTFPVVSVNLLGLESQTTMWRAAMAMAQGDIAPIAVPTAAVAVLVPCCQIMLLIWVLWFARTARRAPGFEWAMKLLGVLRPWSMVEVCMLGILVAVIKLSGLLQVHPGPGVWAMAALMVLMTIIAGRDVSHLWAMTRPRPGSAAAASPSNPANPANPA